jgi:rhodanese-related sulfurtransferase
MIPHLTPTELADDIDSYLLLDVREQDEWDAGHAPQAVHYPMSKMMIEGIEGIDLSRRFAIICRSGGRSYQVAETLVEADVVAINVTGGMQAWKAEGFDVVSTTGEVGVII